VHPPVASPAIGARGFLEYLVTSASHCFVMIKNIGTLAALVTTRKSKTVLNFNFAKEST
jgi:hypothetical protein